MTLDEAIDELYGAPLDDFVRERTRLAKELADGGRKEEAATLRALRKPSVAAWVLNQLTRRNRREVDLLLDSGHRLRRAQAGVLGGGEKDAFAQAQTTQRDALRALGRDAEGILRERGSGSSTVAAEVAASLRAAAVSDRGRELLARGRFTGPFEAEGFEIVSQLAESAAAGRPRRRTRADEARREKLREAVKDAERRVREAEHAARAADARAEELRREADDAEDEARRTHAELDAAHDALARAESAAADLPETSD